MLSVARNRERVLTFVIDYQWSQPKSVFAEERMSEVETERRSERGRQRRSKRAGARGNESERRRLRVTDDDGARGNESERRSEREWEWEWKRETKSGREWEWDGCECVLKVFLARSTLGHVEGRKEIESNGLDFYVQKPSPLDLIYMYKNRVHWTRFYVQKSSPLDLISMYKNRVQWTRFLGVRGHFVHLSYWQNRKLEYSILNL